MKLLLFPTIAFAKSDKGDGQTQIEFNLQAPKNSDSFQVITTYLNHGIPVFQGLSAVILVIACIGVGTKLGVSSAFGDARGRQENIVGLFWIIVAGVIVIHAKAIVGASASIGAPSK